MSETKEVGYQALKEGQEIKGYIKDGTHCSFRAYVKSANIAGVVVNKWKPNGYEETIDSSARFLIEMTDDELLRKYESDIKELLVGIQNRLTRDQLGYKEQWNSWLYGDPVEMAAHTVKNNFKIVGYSEDVESKHSMFTDDIMDIAVCGEYQDTQDRFWCHYSYKNLKYLLEDHCSKYNVEITEELKKKFESVEDNRRRRRKKESNKHE